VRALLLFAAHVCMYKSFGMSLHYDGNGSSCATLYPIPEHPWTSSQAPRALVVLPAPAPTAHTLVHTGHQARATFAMEEELARDARDLAVAVVVQDTPAIAQKTVEVAVDTASLASALCAWLCPPRKPAPETQTARVAQITPRPVNPDSFPPSVERSTHTRS
jgi:hypothetical protein